MLDCLPLERRPLLQSSTIQLPVYTFRTNTRGTMNGQQLRERAMVHLNAAMELVEQTEKADYLTALRIVPKLVLLESDPLKYLQCADFNPWAASRSLATYWKRRREIFGGKAFLPMALIGKSALSPEDIEFIKGGSMVILPNDSQGRSVLCVDTRRVDYPAAVRIRSGFYIHQVLSENTNSQALGVVIFVLVRAVRRKDKGPNIRSLILPLFPVKSRSYHIFNCLPYWPSSGILDGFMDRLVRFFQDLLMDRSTRVHASQRHGDIISSMAVHGLHSNGIPTCIGGSWTYENFPLWLANRTLLEQARYSEFNTTAAALPQGGQPLKKRRVESDSDTVQRRFDLKQTMGTLITQLPNSQAYNDARKAAPPETWVHESDLDAFLRLEEFNPDRAARRVLDYWNLRSKFFGPKRFESMHQTGEAALGRKDLAALVTGFAQLLPYDKQNCSILWIDGFRVPGGSSANLDRCLFYMLSLLSENAQSQKEGARLLYRIDPNATDAIPMSTLERLAAALPFKFKAIHLISQSPIPADVTGGVGFGDELYVHIGASKDELFAKFESFGMTKSGLPTCLKGDFNYSRFIQWQELRTRMEWKVPLGLSGRSSLAEFPTLRTFDALPDSEKKERSRRLNVMHCRRKKYRILVETDLLQDQSKELEDEQVLLKEEHSKLKNLLASAMDLVGNSS